MEVLSILVTRHFGIRPFRRRHSAIASGIHRAQSIILGHNFCAAEYRILYPCQPGYFSLVSPASPPVAGSHTFSFSRTLNLRLVLPVSPAHPECAGGSPAVKVERPCRTTSRHRFNLPFSFFWRVSPTSPVRRSPRARWSPAATRRRAARL